MNTSISDSNWGTQHDRSSYFDYRCTFRTVFDSYCCVTEHSRQRAVMDTSLSDINEACGTIDTECVGLSVSQSWSVNT